MECIIISGMSGAGKSMAVDVLEDSGYYCIDNIPCDLAPHFIDLFLSTAAKYKKVALVVDVRSDANAESLFTLRSGLTEKGIPCYLLFLDCSNEQIINRHKANRRRHPLDTNGDIYEAVTKERARMDPVRLSADYVIDTTSLSTANLKSHLLNLFGEGGAKSAMVISILSFGFKHGIPHESDMVFDARFIENPFYVPELRPKCGLDKEVYDFVFNKKPAVEFSDRIFSLLDYLIPLYLSEGKTSLVVSVGCTGGRHRSVAIAENLKARLENKNHNVVIRHRDIEKG
ncbi:MAG: RNase adapter RapZ [Clostridia bacterium]|nr:RNase adapter RapZ [Clostridia bacterium]MBR3865615.1 RNase adapter RapZ [Clostridia bacterium]